MPVICLSEQIAMNPLLMRDSLLQNLILTLVCSWVFPVSFASFSSRTSFLLFLVSPPQPSFSIWETKTIISLRHLGDPNSNKLNIMRCIVYLVSSTMCKKLHKVLYKYIMPMFPLRNCKDKPLHEHAEFFSWKRSRDAELILVWCYHSIRLNQQEVLQVALIPTLVLTLKKNILWWSVALCSAWYK